MGNYSYCTFAVFNSVHYTLDNRLPGRKVPHIKEAFEAIVPLEDREKDATNPLRVFVAIYYESIIIKVWEINNMNLILIVINTLTQK